MRRNQRENHERGVLGRCGTVDAECGMRNMRPLALLLAFGLATGGASLLVGCEREGPAERAGEKLDRKLDKLEDKIDPKGPAEKTGEKIDKALD
jgi:hypothetical protein